MTFEDTLIGRPGTIRVQTTFYRNWIKPYIQTKTLREMVQIWQRAGLAPRSIKTLISLSHRYYVWKGLPDPDSKALSQLISKQIPPNPPKALTKNESKKLIETWDSLYPEHVGLVTLGLHGGVRIGEAFGLRWEDVDFVRGRIQILRSYDGPTKNGRGRLIQMSNFLAQSLLKRDNYIGRSVKEPVFRRFNVNPKLKRACGRAGIKPVTFHALRHTFATLALESKTNSIKAISTTLGHSSVKTTLDTYWHVLGDRLDLDFLD